MRAEPFHSKYSETIKEHPGGLEAGPPGVFRQTSLDWDQHRNLRNLNSRRELMWIVATAGTLSTCFVQKA